MKNFFYPLVFYPIFKERIWGGTQLKNFNKDFDQEKIGESWEVSSLENDTSIIFSGHYKGYSLNELIALFPEEILGKDVILKHGTQFPLLIKFLDAQQDLSIQLHPNDELAQKRHQSFGKTEMWYVVDAEKDARIIIGFKKDSNQKEYLEYLNNKNLLEILEEIPVKKGDIFMLETGTIHAIGAGIVIAEIQQTSDITYRIYDWDRVDSHGNSRELHTELALDAINYKTTNSKINYSKNSNELNATVQSQYFTTSILFLEKDFLLNINEKFVILMCIDGTFEIEHDSIIYTFKKGDTILLPAILKNIILKGNATILHITI
jgi:mannose-6-phosphate isomerase